jgi:V/A-type H+-transporting ATPase subunit I
MKSFEQFGSVQSLPSLSGTPKQAKSELEAKAEKLSEKLAAAKRKLENFTNMHYPRLAAVEEALQIEADRAEIATQFSASSSLYYIEGWAEDARFDSLQQQMKEKFGKKVLLLKSSPSHHDSPPTKLENPKHAGPFQFVVEFLSTTGYSEIDPTLLLTFFIPIIYALIFGDAGYAVMSFLLASFMITKSKEGALLNQIAKIWRLAAVPAFLAGIIFDEYIGFTHTHLLEVLGMGHISLYEGLHRVESITTLMLICIIAGMVHLAAGFILGAINEWHHSRKHSIAKLCWLGIEIAGFFLVAAGMFNAFPAFMIPALALFVLCVIGLIATEGPIAAVEIPGLASNIMSYIRIAAVGVGGVILAEAINELLLPKFDASPVGIIVFLFTAAAYIAIHVASCVLAMFESFIHGARLNVVEFFGKFYKGNGTKFSPFSAKRLYTQEAV